ncbi:hypothetical protein [Paenibacillus glucanolyticus]|uniref:hypothetical protein n=1 Tax=Paenibacillus glucanolyticus TaxID=59843 RepID=UPI00096CEA1A|nr:hypothetical protein [Paenibacillus glucanolyticus]OMF76763.1 hypothetical protein BK142_14690 [Paenibacillus glucanolyticus]
MNDIQRKIESEITDGDTTETNQGKTKGAVKETKSARASMRLLKEDKAFVVYWAEVFGMDSTELMMRGVRHYVAWRNQDFDLPTAEMQRLNQLIDAMENMASSNERLSNTVINGFDAMMGIMRGDNYLLEPENGDLVNERG